MRHRATSIRKRRGGACDGLTLVEVVIALFLFATVIGGMCQLMVNVKKTSDQARDHYVAINVAKNQIERARTFPFERLVDLAESGTVVDHNGAPDANGRYRRIVQINPVASNKVELLLTVDIRNRLTGHFDGESENLQTYIANMQQGPPE